MRGQRLALGQGNIATCGKAERQMGERQEDEALIHQQFVSRVDGHAEQLRGKWTARQELCQMALAAAGVYVTCPASLQTSSSACCEARSWPSSVTLLRAKDR
ncbi:hypothetical protein GOP47_0019186 [Adiantum capillus-veneris]|uniref:Uncharacterized protein n=1 Tax=Adiantum capillus-veneris TaxID=13818 RepID=A0A9D4ZAA1_ADICA|nr:hypothetical protein GOP47_0019022 [Adiantum capillus-veneris]KAI5066562.1 hypothetical protein GOP47_0019186 [Adiantum capillus-veneris]